MTATARPDSQQAAAVAVPGSATLRWWHFQQQPCLPAQSSLPSCPGSHLSGAQAVLEHLAARPGRPATAALEDALALLLKPDPATSHRDLLDVCAGRADILRYQARACLGFPLLHNCATLHELALSQPVCSRTCDESVPSSMSASHFV